MTKESFEQSWRVCSETEVGKFRCCLKLLTSKDSSFLKKRSWRAEMNFENCQISIKLSYYNDSFQVKSKINFSFSVVLFNLNFSTSFCPISLRNFQRSCFEIKVENLLKLWLSLFNIVIFIVAWKEQAYYLVFCLSETLG